MDERNETRAMVHGAVVGAALGALIVWGYRRLRGRTVPYTRKPVKMEGIVRLGSTVVQLLRQLAELA